MEVLGSKHAVRVHQLKMKMRLSGVAGVSYQAEDVPCLDMVAYFDTYRRGLKVCVGRKISPPKSRMMWFPAMVLSVIGILGSAGFPCAYGLPFGNPSSVKLTEASATA